LPQAQLAGFFNAGVALTALSTNWGGKAMKLFFSRRGKIDLRTERVLMALSALQLIMGLQIILDPL